MAKDNSMEIEAGLLLLNKYAPIYLTERGLEVASILRGLKQKVV
jgi:hypothetical protein